MAFGLIYFHKYLKVDFTPHFGTINKQTCIIFINHSRNVTYLAPEIATHVARLREIRVANIDGNFLSVAEIKAEIVVWFPPALTDAPCSRCRKWGGSINRGKKKQPRTVYWKGSAVAKVHSWSEASEVSRNATRWLSGARDAVGAGSVAQGVSYVTRWMLQCWYELLTFPFPSSSNKFENNLPSKCRQTTVPTLY